MPAAQASPKGQRTAGRKAGRKVSTARKDEIIDAAERVFASKPFPRVSMRDIAREAGISPALIYRHFADQQHLFLEAFFRGAEHLMGRIDELFKVRPESGLEDASAAFISFLAENEHYFKMMTHFMLEGTVHEGLLERLNSIERSVLDRFDELFRKAGAVGDVRILSHCFFASLNGILITFRRHPGRTKEEVVSHMHRLGITLARLFAHALRTANVGP